MVTKTTLSFCQVLLGKQLFFGYSLLSMRPFFIRDCIPCVGLVVLVGCFMFIVVPDDEKPAEPRFLRAENALPTIVIDPGHGGRDDGARSRGIVEKNMTLDVAKRLDNILRENGFLTFLTREEDTYVSLSDRVTIANRFDDALFISIHFNQGASGADGIETYYADVKTPPEFEWTWVGFFSRPHTALTDTGEKLAGFIQTSVVTNLNAGNRGIKSRSLYVVRNVRSPAVLVEGGFISNPMEAQLLCNDSYRDRLASAIADGIASYIKSQHAAKPTYLAASSEPHTKPPEKTGEK